MISSLAFAVRKASVAVLLLVIVAAQTVVSAGFLNTPLSSVRGQHDVDHPRFYTRTHRGFGRNTNIKSIPLVSQKGGKAVTEIRGGGRKSKNDSGDDDDEQLKDYSGSVAGLFGNLRIPASLIAGASLGSAFALPFAATDDFRIALAKRMYVFSLMTSLASNLLVVILSTICMNDITIRPARLSTSVRDYLDDQFILEWLLVRVHFFYGAFAFIIAAAFRAWIAISCPVIGSGVVGIMASLTLISLSVLIEKARAQTGGSRVRQTLVVRLLKEVWSKSKTNVLFAAGIALWVATVAYLIVKVPHIYAYLASL